MLTLQFDKTEYYNDIIGEFGYVDRAQKITFEHSLVSLSKWESKWCKPFLHSEKTDEETIDYIRCMVTTQNVDPNIFEAMLFDCYGPQMKQLSEYIEAPMTAATFYTIGEDDSKGSKTFSDEIVTAETVYYWMISYGIPVEFQKWHLKRLIALIRFFSVKNTKDNKLSQQELAHYYRSQNAARRKALGSKG